MAVPLGSLPDFVASLLNSYVLPYVPRLVVLLLAVAFGGWAGGRRRVGGQKRALREELSLNLRQAPVILEFVEAQKTGESYITPIPRFYTTAYEEVRRSGNLRSLRRVVKDELITIYSAIDSIDEASDRQAELLAGAAATSPIAEDLRNQNLTYIRDTVTNVVLPRLERLSL